VTVASSVSDAFGFSPNREMGWDFSTVMDNSLKTVAAPIPGMRVTVNPGTFSEEAGISVTTDPANNARHTSKDLIKRAMDIERARGSRSGSLSHYPISSLTFEITGETPGGSVIRGVLGNQVLITMGYPDANGDGIVDDTDPPVSAKDLEFYHLDEALGEFKKVAGSSANQSEKTVSASVSHFSIYGVMGALAPDVSGFLIRPNPWEVYRDPKPVLLDNLPDPAEIKVYTVTGQRVTTLNGNGAGTIEWNGTNDQGEALASGVYVLVLKGAGGTKVKKLTIIR
jgi:hypothetical protein